MQPPRSEIAQPIRGPLPPVFFFVALLLEIALRFLIPIAFVIPRPAHFFGVALIVGGLALAIVASGQFIRSGTPLPPSSIPTTLVTSGIYRITRNPIYLGMFLALVGTCVLMRAISPFIVPGAFVWIITNRFIEPEERNLRALFGARYAEYQRSVRRWI